MYIVEILLTTTNYNTMAFIKLQEKKLKPVVILTTTLFIVLALLYFLPGVKIPHKLSFPLLTLTIAGLWVLPWQMTLAMFFSFLGDYMGTCGNFIGQMGFFALAHVWIVAFFWKRYNKMFEPQRKKDGQEIAMYVGGVVIVLILLYVVKAYIRPNTPEGIIRYGVMIYSTLILFMLFASFYQKSALFTIGAILFVFSDFILAWNKFVSPIPGEKYLIMVPYYSAQFLLFIRAIKYKVESDKKAIKF